MAFSLDREGSIAAALANSSRLSKGLGGRAEQRGEVPFRFGTVER
ncbi:MAG: hypothetical protein AVDCRST_MAG62-73 [uncultured Sphingomonas sp.]|uniref:Uncharacterized protein n=1 Tax=uncultured Sphingomonas sp. TaxID=158754 RepID=A0A6J4SR22_9SPHN|nr:MAG: hypothetical protein AVDCRST_MAG62-73 [uncultured Sphingomonas sp.]